MGCFTFDESPLTGQPPASAGGFACPTKVALTPSRIGRKMGLKQGGFMTYRMRMNRSDWIFNEILAFAVAFTLIYLAVM